MLRSAQVVVVLLSVGSAVRSGTVTVVWLKCDSMDMLFMNTSVSCLLSADLPLGMKM